MKRLVSMFCLLTFLVSTLAVLEVAVPRAAGQETKSGSAVVEVKIDNFSFGPMDLTVGAGTTVTWINHDDIPHTVVSTENAFKSKVMDTDEKFSYTFMKPGVYPYFCSVHPKMTARVIVK